MNHSEPYSDKEPRVPIERVPIRSLFHSSPYATKAHSPAVRANLEPANNETRRKIRRSAIIATAVHNASTAVLVGATALASAATMPEVFLVLVAAFPLTRYARAWTYRWPLAQAFDAGGERLLENLDAVQRRQFNARRLPQKRQSDKDLKTIAAEHGENTPLAYVTSAMWKTDGLIILSTVAAVAVMSWPIAAGFAGIYAFKLSKSFLRSSAESARIGVLRNFW